MSRRSSQSFQPRSQNPFARRRGPPALPTDDTSTVGSAPPFQESDPPPDGTQNSPAGGGTPDGSPVTSNIPPNVLVTGYYRRFFKEICKLGSGSFGQVYLCSHSIDDLDLGEYAIKKIPVGDNKEWLQRMIKEVKIREKLHHPNVVDYKHSWLEMHRTNELCPYVPWLFVLMEYCNGGDLESMVLPPDGNAPQVLSDATLWKLLSDILLGLQHLHQNGIIHRDLKLSNILLQCRVNEVSGRMACSAFLADFGTAQLVSDRREAAPSAIRGYTGTVEYTAPELLAVDAEGNFVEDYDAKSDIWSVGVIMFALLTGLLPFASTDPSICRELILRADEGAIAEVIERQAAACDRSRELAQLVEALLAKDPKERPSVDDLLYHPKLQQYFRNAEYLEGASAELAAIVSALADERRCPPNPRRGWKGLWRPRPAGGGPDPSGSRGREEILLRNQTLRWR